LAAPDVHVIVIRIFSVPYKMWGALENIVQSNTAHVYIMFHCISPVLSRGACIHEHDLVRSVNVRLGLWTLPLRNDVYPPVVSRLSCASSLMKDAKVADPARMTS
jgi:hypothetical protein